MWNEKPKNWPDDLPYCDPNNQLKGGNGKPSQKILLRMFSFLMKNYFVSWKDFGVSQICVVANFSLMMSSHWKHGPSKYRCFLPLIWKTLQI